MRMKQGLPELSGIFASRVSNVPTVEIRPLYYKFLGFLTNEPPKKETLVRSYSKSVNSFSCSTIDINLKKVFN